MTTAWKYRFFDSYDKVEALLDDIIDLRHAGKPVFAGYLPELEMYVVAHERLTPEKVMEWWNTAYGSEPDERLTSPPVLQL